MHQKDPLLFISYATPDRERVLPSVRYLESAGFNVWIDFQQLKAGQNWDLEIKRVLNKADFIIMFFSTNSVDRRGYVQREIKIALDKHKERLASDIYLIPVLLDDGISIPEAVADLHCIRHGVDDRNKAIADAVNHQLAAVGAAAKVIQEKSKISWTHRSFGENWDGLPGYETELMMIDLSSSKYPDIRYASDYFNSLLLDSALNMRDAKFSQEVGTFNFGHEKHSRTNTFDGGVSEPIVVGKVLSLQAAIHFYFAGAAHGNMNFYTTAYILEPLIRIPSLESIFIDAKTAFAEVSRLVRESLIRGENHGEDQYERDIEWINRGTSTWEALSHFVFREKHLDILFAPYEVDCYAAGPQFASVQYKDIFKLLRPEYLAALDLSSIFGSTPAWLSE